MKRLYLAVGGWLVRRGGMYACQDCGGYFSRSHMCGSRFQHTHMVFGEKRVDLGVWAQMRMDVAPAVRRSRGTHDAG